MVNQDPNIKFVKAVVNWLSLFPDSRPQIAAYYSNLTEPLVIIEVLRTLTGPDFDADVGSQVNEEEKDHFAVTGSKAEAYEAIFTSLKSYFKSRLFSRKKLYSYIEMLKYDELQNGDLFSLNTLCFIFLEIGLHSFKSSISISIISELNEEDQRELKNVMYDENDLFGKNLMLTQRLSTLELENVKLRESCKKLEQDQKALHKRSQVNENEKHGIQMEYETVIHDKELQIEKLKHQLSIHKSQNDDLKQENLQLKNDLEDLNRAKSIPPKKKSYHTIESPSVNPSHNNRPIASEELKWEYNLLTSWLNRLYANKKPR